MSGGIFWNQRFGAARLREEANFTKSGLNVDLKNFDPREYDPRKMIKDAVAEEMQLWMEQATSIEKAATQGLVPEKTPDNPQPSADPKPDDSPAKPPAEPPVVPPATPRQEKPA